MARFSRLVSDAPVAIMRRVYLVDRVDVLPLDLLHLALGDLLESIQHNVLPVTPYLAMSVDRASIRATIAIRKPA
jgi:hypothetical protein